MSYDQQLARRLAVHNKARRASRTMRPMCVKPRYYTNKGMVWNLIGLYGQVVAGYRTPRRAKEALRQAQYLQRKFDSAHHKALAECRRHFDDIETAAVHVEVCYVETEHNASLHYLGCVRE